MENLVIIKIGDGLYCVDKTRININNLLNGKPGQVVPCNGNPAEVVKFIGLKDQMFHVKPTNNIFP